MFDEEMSEDKERIPVVPGARDIVNNKEDEVSRNEKKKKESIHRVVDTKTANWSRKGAQSGFYQTKSWIHVM